MTAILDPNAATDWVRRWDAQQEFYVPDREERFAVIGDVVEHVVRDTTEPAVLDLGCGPGSLSSRLADRLPNARITAVDADPLLLALARAQRSDRITFVDADLTTPGWTDQVPARLDAVVSTTALHWLDREPLAELYRTLARLVRPGGVFVNGDHLGTGDPRLNELAKLVLAGRARRAGVVEHEDWDQWWAAVRADNTLGPLLDERSTRSVHHHGGNHLSVAEHAELLRSSGFQTAGPVWQSGDDHVLVAIR
ncbi:MAG TPA: class I SAM-dependent methyltransferase [Pseudonocardiaceae bacterium]|nr:class I SAM-dependent methyltransferase [Pseudonocardiaceae bacterium]